MNFSRITRTICSDQMTEFSYNFHTVLKTFDWKKQLHIIGVKQHTDVFEYHRYSVDKPNETQWSEMTPLWDTQFLNFEFFLLNKKKINQWHDNP
jgi:hypothetical protein